MLPDAAVLRDVVNTLFNVLVNKNSTAITTTKVVVTCRLFDDRIPIEVLEETMRSVDANGDGTMSEDDLYRWVVLMFGDCTTDELLGGVRQLGEAPCPPAGLLPCPDPRPAGGQKHPRAEFCSRG
jgi:hypothetical protein